MAHYTIPIQYNFNPNSQSGKVTEYFLPFSVPDLLRFELDDFTRESLAMLRHKSAYPLDEIARRADPGLRMTLVRRPDEEIEDLRNWNPFDDDPETAVGFSLWDLYAEASLMFFASRNYKENIEHVNLLAGATARSQEELLTLKVRLSLLLHFAHEKHVSMPPTPDGPSETGTDIHNIYDVIDFYEAVDRRRMEQGILPDVIQSWMNGLDQFDPAPGEAAFCIHDICELLRINTLHEPDSVQYRNNWIAINRLKVDLLQWMWKPYSDAFHFDTAAKLVMNIIDKPKRRRNIRALRTFLEEDATSAAAVMEHTRQHVRQFQNHAASICLVNYAGSSIGDPEWKKFARYFHNSPEATGMIKNAYRKQKKSCFALLFTDGPTHYFSMSGIGEELKPGYGKMKEPHDYILENILNRIGPNNKKVFQYAPIHPELKVRRYTKLLSGEIADEDRSDSYIYPDYVTFDQEFKSDPTITMGTFGSTYGCCERKMLAYSGYEHARTIFSRWVPCWKCCPAVLDAPHVEVYAFGKTEEYHDIMKEKDGKLEVPELKQYRVRRELRYDVEVIDQDESTPEQP